MPVSIRKYNPGFLSDEEIVAQFCVRNAELEYLLESLHASDGNSNVHSSRNRSPGQWENASSVASGGRGAPRSPAFGVLPGRIS